MRLLLFMLLLPSLALAQPADISLAQVAGFARADFNGDTRTERVVLTLDPEGVIALYIYGEGEDVPLAYIPDFAATTGDAPILRQLPDKSFTIMLTGTTGLGYYARARKVTYVDDGFYIVGLLNEFYPKSGEGVRRCAYDLAGGVVTITRLSGAVLETPTDIGPLPLDGTLPDSLTNLCAN